MTCVICYTMIDTRYMSRDTVCKVIDTRYMSRVCVHVSKSC
jgi:hypothetical protein